MLEFFVKPTILDCDTLSHFVEKWELSEKDLIISNKYVLEPQLDVGALPCQCIFQEEFGSGEPSDEMIDAMLLEMKGKNYNRIIAIGGGTVIDISKLFVFGSGLTCEQIFEQGAELKRKSQLIIIPTTCGTGSEVTGISIVEFKKKQTKIGLAIPALYADEAVLIPSMLQTLPYEVFATSSVDALIHAVESYVSPKANDFTRALGRSAIEKILNGYQAIMDTGKRQLPKNMEDFLVASTMAGISFSNAGCAAVHALSYPIGGEYHVPHGKANFTVFEQVFIMYQQLNADVSPLEDVLKGVFGDVSSVTLWKTFFNLLNGILDKASLKELGMNEEKAAQMATSVIQNQQRLLNNNPVLLSEENIKTIYMRCL